MTTLLWRIEPTSPGVANLPHLAEDLALHLRYAPLTIVLVQIGNRQQAYLAGPACAGCRQQRCGPDCAMQLLRRALIADQVAIDVRPVPLGLIARPYTRLALAVPGPRAQSLDPTLVSAYPEARLWLSWHTMLGQRMVGAALAVGSVGPEPGALLRAHGWLALAAEPLRRPLAATAIPPALPCWPSQLPPHLLLPQSIAPSTLGPDETLEVPALTQSPVCQVQVPLIVAGQMQGIITSVLLSHAQAKLSHLVQRPPAHQDEPMQQVEPDAAIPISARAAPQPAAQSIDWPAGPVQMPPERLGQLLTVLVQSPSMTEGRPGRVGLAIPRLKSTLGLTKAEASALLCWLDQADLLEPAIDPQQPWRQPRPLATADLHEIATRLHATPIS